ncbi:MAG: hypothetical protein FWG75_01145 [Cystobacterineae bacterium]|nr:hypothetical protein [Cystobacterineae bacterium]
MHNTKKGAAYSGFPADKSARKALEKLNPFELRARGLKEALRPEEFARALFQIKQRRKPRHGVHATVGHFAGPSIFERTQKFGAADAWAAARALARK